MIDNWFTILTYIYWLVLIYVTLQIVIQYTISSRASAWLFTVYVFPVVGIIVYFIFGVKRRNRKRYQQKCLKDQKYLQEYRSKYDEPSHVLTDTERFELKRFYGLPQMIFNESLNQVTVKNNLTLLENGEKKFSELFADIKSAQHTIHLEYYIFKLDDIGKELMDLLVKKSQQGVVVRVIYDHYGSSGLDRTTLKHYRSFGIEIWPFAEIELFEFTAKLNYRNHRKIIVIDGCIAYVGGINVGDEYNNNNTKNKTYWRDTHLKIEGDGVVDLQKIFITDWNFCTGQDIKIEELPNSLNELTIDDCRMMQVVASGPDSPLPIILLSILRAINMAKSEILITTPYFIPNPSLVKALKIAVLSGVDVNILVPDQSDSKVVNAAAQSYYYELMLVGVNIYKYTKGFIHAKTMVVDSYLSIIGTSNFDERSFELNFEVNAVIYDERIASELSQSFALDIKDAKEISVDSWDKRSKITVFIEKLARLISPIL